MAPKDRWDLVYHRCFKNQPEGHALYQSLSTKDFQPGSCGFFDDNSIWQLVADLTDKDPVKKFDKAPNLRVKKVEGAQWPLRISHGVRGTKLGVQAGYVDANHNLLEY
jgi:hypothetical protein